MTQSLASPTDAVNVTAEVRAHDRVVRYRRSGNTGPHLLLVVADSTSDLWPEFPRLLADRFRLLMPDLPEPAAEATRSLRCLLDGLGASGVSLLAAGRHCDAALALVLSGDESVGRVVLVPELSDDQFADPAEAVAAPRVAKAPIYVVSRRLSADEAMERVTEYLK